MTGYLLAVYTHIVVAIFLMGYMLFWTIIVGSLAQRYEAPEATRLLRLIQQSSWPPKGLPASYRIKFSGLGWIALLVLIATGMIILAYREISWQAVFSKDFLLSSFGERLGLKCLFVTALLIGQLLLSYRPAAPRIYLCMGAALVVVVLSVLLTR
jgi:hypothetical protein